MSLKRRAIAVSVALAITIPSVANEIDALTMARFVEDSYLSDRLENASAILSGDVSLLVYRLRIYQIGQLAPEELRVLRNTIFALHGYSFESVELSDHFTQQTWYRPRQEFSESDLSDIDRYNVELILNYESSLTSVDHELQQSDIVGIWHPLPLVPAGYADRYFFNSDRTFRWVPSQMDGAMRMREIHGTWELSRGVLGLTVSGYRWSTGGELQQAFGSYASDYVIEDDAVFNMEQKVPVMIRIPVTDFGADTEGRLNAGLGGIVYWRGPYDD